MARRTLRLALVMLFGSTLPLAGFAESPAGQWQLELANTELLSVVPADFADCEDVAIPGIVGSACWTFVPDIDPNGIASGSLTVVYDTDVITGTLSAELFGRFAGRSGTPPQPGAVGSTKVKLGMDLTGTLHVVPLALDAETHAKTRCSGVVAHGPDPADLRCRVKVCVAFAHPELPGRTVRDCVSTESFLTLTPALVDGEWTLDLDVADDGNGALSGTATATFRGQTLDYAITGKYSATKDRASLRLEPTATRGSSIRIRNLVVSGGQIQTGELAYKLFGHRGRTELAP